jgi:hypothetical protein
MLSLLIFQAVISISREEKFLLVRFFLARDKFYAIIEKEKK